MKIRRGSKTIDMPNFSKHEFSEDPELYANLELLENLQSFRTMLGKKIYPSKANGALARDDESSQHHAIGRHSTAIDVFTDAKPFEMFISALNSKLWGGIGVYFDTSFNDKPSIMFHLDTRENPLLWYRSGGMYHYPGDTFDQDLLSMFCMRR